MTQNSWTRRAYLRALVGSAQRTGDAFAPWRHLGAVDAPFDGEGEILAELHREWLRVLVTRLHRHGIVAERTHAGVSAVYAEACADHPTLRRILDAHASAPALREPTRREHLMLARVAGLGAFARADREPVCAKFVDTMTGATA